MPAQQPFPNLTSGLYAPQTGTLPLGSLFGAPTGSSLFSTDQLGGMYRPPPLMNLIHDPSNPMRSKIVWNAPTVPTAPGGTGTPPYQMSQVPLPPAFTQQTSPSQNPGQMTQVSPVTPISSPAITNPTPPQQDLSGLYQALATQFPALKQYIPSVNVGFDIGPGESPPAGAAQAGPGPSLPGTSVNVGFDVGPGEAIPGGGISNNYGTSNTSPFTYTGQTQLQAPNVSLDPLGTGLWGGGVSDPTLGGQYQGISDPSQTDWGGYALGAGTQLLGAVAPGAGIGVNAAIRASQGIGNALNDEQSKTSGQSGFFNQLYDWFSNPGAQLGNYGGNAASYTSGLISPNADTTGMTDFSQVSKQIQNAMGNPSWYGSSNMLGGPGGATWPGGLGNSFGGYFDVGSLGWGGLDTLGPKAGT